MADNHYDVIIIGSGAGGGTLAYRLAPTGKKILILERGDYVLRERENWDSHSVVIDGRYNIKEAWRDKHGEEFHAEAHYYVGGNTNFYGAALLRMRREDFGALRHLDTTSPALPIGYEVLEPYYTEAEHLSRSSAGIGPRGRSVPDRHRVRWSSRMAISDCAEDSSRGALGYHGPDWGGPCHTASCPPRPGQRTGTAR